MLFHYKFQVLIAVFFMMILSPFVGMPQEVNQWGTGISGSYSQPIAGLSNWFRPALNWGISCGQQYNEKWFIDGLIEYSRFDRENLSGYAAGKVDLLLEHYEIQVSGRYQIAKTGRFKPYFNLAGGIYQWKGIRGEILADATVTPYIPHIDAKKIEETNWGFRTGIGLEVKIVPALSLDILGYYRFIVGDLWPTLQPKIELEGVSGFQTINLAVGMRYYF